jgi:predicted transcriptional regulator
LWPFPDDDLPSEISIWEGESDAGTAHAAGLPYAFAVTKGADTNITEQHFQSLADRGVRSVLIGSDTDAAGLKLREVLERAAVNADLDVHVVELERIIDPFTGGNDLNWVWKNCESAGQFQELIQDATRDARSFDPSMTHAEMESILVDDELWFIPDLLAPSDKVLIVGPQKAYKTWIKLDLVRSLIAGTPFLNRQEWTPVTPRKVLVVQEEGSRRRWASRMSKLGLTDTQWDKYLKVWHREGFRFTEEERVSSIISYMREHEIEVVLFDPLQRMIPGVNENDSAETGVVWDAVMRMQQVIPGLVVVIVHHANKSDRMTWESVRGSSRHAGEVDLGVFVEKHPVSPNKVRIGMDGRDVTAELGPGEAFEGEVKIEEDHFEIDAADMKVNLRAKAIDHHTDAVLKAVRGGRQTRTEIMHEVGLKDTAVRKYLDTLVTAGQVQVTGTGDHGQNLYGIVD